MSTPSPDDRGSRSPDDGADTGASETSRQASGKQFERGTESGPPPSEAPEKPGGPGAGASASGKRFARGTDSSGTDSSGTDSSGSGENGTAGP